MINAYPDATRKGTLSFKNSSVRLYKHHFVVSAEHERVALMHDEETPKTLYKLQKVPDAFKPIGDDLSKVGARLESGPREAPSNNELQLTGGADETAAARR